MTAPQSTEGARSQEPSRPPVDGPMPRDRRYRLLHLQVTATFGGDESNSLLLCRHLPEMRHFISVYFGSGPMIKAWQDSGASVGSLDLDPADWRGLMRAVRETVATVQPDGVFLGSVSLLPVVLKGLDGFGGEVLCHTGNPDSSSGLTRVKFWLARALLRPTVRPTMVHCSAYVGRSYARNAFFRRYRHEVAVSAGLLDVDGEAARLHQPKPLSPPDPVRVGMVARLDPIKDHRLVIRAFPSILVSFPSATLELIGEGSERRELEGLAVSLGLSERVRFHGRVPSPFPIVREWDLFLYATTAAEGFGAALAEAMALGMPCVVTDIGPMREVGGEDGAVAYVPPDAAALALSAVALLNNHAERIRLSNAARTRAKKAFAGSHFARRIASLLGTEAAAVRESSARLTYA
jgi:glycosyltransferase involved in cell wall biosynthesis